MRGIIDGNELSSVITMLSRLRLTEINWLQENKRRGELNDNAYKRGVENWCVGKLVSI